MKIMLQILIQIDISTLNPTYLDLNIESNKNNASISYSKRHYNISGLKYLRQLV